MVLIFYGFPNYPPLGLRKGRLDLLHPFLPRKNTVFTAFFRWLCVVAEVRAGMGLVPFNVLLSKSFSSGNIPKVLPNILTLTI